MTTRSRVLPKYATAARYASYEVLRTIPTDAGHIEMRLACPNGVWCEVDGWRDVLPVPGARDMTVREFVRGREREVQRHGHWIEVRREVIGDAQPMREWAQRRCNSELSSGGYQFEPQEWEQHCEESLDLPYIPEFDAKEPEIRQLAHVERRRRYARRDLEELRRERDAFIRTASSRGHSRRDLAKLTDLSFGRIHQIVSSEPP